MRKINIKEELKGLWVLISTVLGFLLLGVGILGTVELIGWMGSFLNNLSNYVIWIIGVPLIILLIGALFRGISWVIEKLKNS